MSRTAPLSTDGGNNFNAAHFGPFANLMQYAFPVPGMSGREIPGKVFVKETLGLTGMEMSMNSFPPGIGTPFLHRHRQHEEIYLIISGEGEFMVDDQVFQLREGSVIRVAPEGVRALRNTGTAALNFLVMQVKARSVDASLIEDGMPVPTPLVWPAATTQCSAVS